VTLRVCAQDVQARTVNNHAKAAGLRPSLLIRSGLISARGCSLKTGIAKTEEKQSASGGTRARSEGR